MTDQPTLAPLIEITETELAGMQSELPRGEPGELVEWSTVEMALEAALAELDAQRRARVQEAATVRREALAIVNALRRGSCWCEVGIGNPMVSRHSAACIAAEELARDQPAEDRATTS